MGTPIVTPQNPCRLSHQWLCDRSSATPRIIQNAKGCFSTKSPVSGPTYVSPLKEILPIAPFTQNPSAPVQALNQSLDKKPKPPTSLEWQSQKNLPKKQKRKKHMPMMLSALTDRTVVFTRAVWQLLLFNTIWFYIIKLCTSLLCLSLRSTVKMNRTMRRTRREVKRATKSLTWTSRRWMSSGVKSKTVLAFFNQFQTCSSTTFSSTNYPWKSRCHDVQYNLGRFQCDQPNCNTFTTFWKYISHFDQEHKETNLSQVDPWKGCSDAQWKDVKARTARGQIYCDTPWRNTKTCTNGCSWTQREARMGLNLVVPGSMKLTLWEREQRN